MPLYGDGLNVRDWLFVRDNCAGGTLLRQGNRRRDLQHRRGNERTNRLFITDRLPRHAGQDESSVDYVGDRPATTVAIRSPATRGLCSAGVPSTAFDDALDETVAFYRDPRDWWEPLTARVKNR